MKELTCDYGSMSDKDRLIEMLKRATTEWKPVMICDEEHFECMWKSDCNRSITIEVSKNFVNIHSGYVGFVSEFGFSDDGNLVFAGAFE